MTERKGTPDILGRNFERRDSARSTFRAPAGCCTAGRAGCTAAGRARGTSAARVAAKQTQWEYLVVSFHEQNGWHARFVNGHELENWQRGPQLHDVLDQLGEDGWELINVVKSEPLYGTMDRIQAFFKRVK